MTENSTAALNRLEELSILQTHYKEFSTFLVDVMENFMGFTCTEVQIDIGQYLSKGPSRGMIQAQRGQAKTTITAIYAVWMIIQQPQTRILIVSAGSGMAKEIANWIIQIINNMDVLECLRPDKSNGDRASVEAFDIHHTLKGPEKSPSVACLGITSNFQGRRADLLIPDDIESSKNSRTDIMRGLLMQLTRDFTSVCSKGKIMYLGTPQSIDSVYNSLPSRGYDVRVWPGRYPTEEEEINYGASLAPMIKERMQKDPCLRTGGGADGSRGKPTDPVLLNENALTEKEIDQGAAYFMLQHMLNTKLMDEDRYPLKPEKLLFMPVGVDRVPISLNWLPAPEYRLDKPTDFPVDHVFHEVCSFSQEWADFTGTCMYIDPAGGGANGDELAYAVTKFRSGYVYVVDVGGIKGGLGTHNQQFIANKAKQWTPNVILVEDNMGGGTFREILTPVILEAVKGNPRGCAIDGVWETGQKETRIIETLEPLISSQRLVIDKGLLKSDWDSCKKYPLEMRQTYSLFFQMARLTRDKGCLAHDDRLDALAGACRYWRDLLNIDKEKELMKSKQEAYDKLIRDPLGNGTPHPSFRNKPKHNLFNRFK